MVSFVERIADSRDEGYGYVARSPFRNSVTVTAKETCMRRFFKDTDLITADEMGEIRYLVITKPVSSRDKGSEEPVK